MFIYVKHKGVNTGVTTVQYPLSSLASRQAAQANEVSA